MLFPLHWPYCLQMHNLPCINCFEWICLLKSFFLTAMTVEMKCFSVWLYNVLILWSGGEVESMWICASCALDRHHSLFTKDINNNLRWGGGCKNDLWPSPFTWLSVCVCLCLPPSWLWRALWPHWGWVMRCLVWRLRTNKHSALFYSTHQFHAHLSVANCVCVCDCLSGIWR